VIIVMKSEKYSICSMTVWGQPVRTSTGSVINSSTNGTILSISWSLSPIRWSFLIHLTFQHPLMSMKKLISRQIKELKLYIRKLSDVPNALWVPSIWLLVYYWDSLEPWPPVMSKHNS
jgi:hypothetical protein